MKHTTTRCGAAMLALAVCLPDVASAECATPVSTDTVHARIDEARSALLDDNLEGVDAVHTSLAAEVPCLDGVPAPAKWADYLVTQSITAFSRNENWQSPLAAALAAHPNVDRVVGPTHPIRTWTLPQVQTTLRPVHSDVTLYIDGRAVGFAGTVSSGQLTQLKDASGQLTSALVGPTDRTGQDLVDKATSSAPVATAPTAAAPAQNSARPGRGADRAARPGMQKAGRITWISGAIVGGTGTLMMGGAWAYALANWNTVPTPQAYSTAVGVDIAGAIAATTGVLAVGTGLTLAHLGKPKPRAAALSIQPSGVQLAGSF